MLVATLFFEKRKTNNDRYQNTQHSNAGHKNNMFERDSHINGPKKSLRINHFNQNYTNHEP